MPLCMCALQRLIESMNNADLDVVVYPTWSNPPRLIGDFFQPDGVLTFPVNMHHPFDPLQRPTWLPLGLLCHTPAVSCCICMAPQMCTNLLVWLLQSIGCSQRTAVSGSFGRQSGLNTCTCVRCRQQLAAGGAADGGARDDGADGLHAPLGPLCAAGRAAVPGAAMGRGPAAARRVRLRAGHAAAQVCTAALS